MSDAQAETERIRLVLQARRAELLAKANVAGVGVGFQQREGMRTGKLALVVMVAKKLPAEALGSRDLIPAELDGVPVDVQEIGEPRAL
jgi:hypothetical protein